MRPTRQKARVSPARAEAIARSGMVAALTICNRNNLSFRFLRNILTFVVHPVRRTQPRIADPRPPPHNRDTGRISPSRDFSQPRNAYDHTKEEKTVSSACRCRVGFHFHTLLITAMQFCVLCERTTMRSDNRFSLTPPPGEAGSLVSVAKAGRALSRANDDVFRQLYGAFACHCATFERPGTCFRDERAIGTVDFPPFIGRSYVEIAFPAPRNPH